MKTQNHRIILFTLALALLTLNSEIVQQAKAGAFFLTGEMTTPCSGATATLLTNGLVLVAGGRNLSTFQETSAAELYDPATGTWKATGSMSVPRINHTATLLPNGKVLVAGGTGTNFAAPYFGTLTNAELYDPVAGTWTETSPMNVARRSHTASLLHNGNVLVAGGTYDQSGRTEIYDPAAGTWTLTGTMTTNREEHTATVLTNGMVLVAGGVVTISVFNSEPTATAELYNPADGTWTATGSMTTNRYDHAATLLKNGKVLVEGNFNSSTTSGDTSAELYDPISGTWSLTGSMYIPREKATATTLADGEVLVAGGESGVFSTDLGEIYNPDTGKWLIAGSMFTLLSGQSATLLANGQVLFAGGEGLASDPSAELYNPETSWKATGSLNIPRASGYTMTLLTNGEVLLAGSSVAGEGVSPEVYNPSNGTWTVIGNMNEPRDFHTATLLANGKVLVAGGSGFNGGINNGVLASAELYDPVTGDWTETGSMENARENHQAILLKNGKVLVTGRDVYNHNSAELYDPVAGTWSTTASTASRTSGTILLPDGEVLAVESNGSAELYDPTAGTWTSVSAMNVTLNAPIALALPGGKAFVVGGYGGTVTAEIYDPSNDKWTAAASTTNLTTLVSPQAATLLSDGRILVEGGGGNLPDSTSGSAIYDPTSDTWTSTLGPMTSDRQGQRAVLLPDGKVLVAGGSSDVNGVTDGITTELFDPAIGTSTPQTIVLVPSPTFTGGAFEFNFTATTGQTFTVWSTTNISMAFTNWISLGSVTDALPGHYQFSDSQATNLIRRFYRVTSP